VRAITLAIRFAAIALTGMVACPGHAAESEQGAHAPCVEDALIVFDASGSMSGDGWGYGSETACTVSRLDKVRATLAEVLPSITRIRRVGLITFGPGPYNQCNVKLDLRPHRECRGIHLGRRQGSDSRGEDSADLSRRASG
jgi:Ca-activated chloride channel homolog